MNHTDHVISDEAFNECILCQEENVRLREQHLNDEAANVLLREQRDDLVGRLEAALMQVSPEMVDSYQAMSEQLAAACSRIKELEAKLAASQVESGNRLIEWSNCTVERAELREQVERYKAVMDNMAEALKSVNGCVDFAYIEGLADRLADLDTTPGSLRDLVERRLLWVSNYTAPALARYSTLKGE